MKSKFDKIIIRIILFNVCVIILYQIGLYIGQKGGYAFTYPVEIFYSINWFSLFFMFSIMVGVGIYIEGISHMKESDLRGVMSIVLVIIAIIIITIGSLWSMWSFALTYGTEEVVYKNNQKIIKRIVPNGLHHNDVHFYEPINIFLMKELYHKTI